MMYISKLVFRGESLADAVLDFFPGFNSVTGASETGKSLVFSLIQFALGGDFPTENLPPEAIGYDKIFMEITTSRDKFTIFRTISEPSKVLVYAFCFDEISNTTVSLYKEYSTENAVKEEKKFSSFLMKAMGCPYKNVVKVDGKNEAFTFAKWLRLTLIDERRVYAEHSIIFSTGSTTDFTYEGARAAFYTVIRGFDDPQVPQKVDIKISKAKLQGQCDQLKEIIDDLTICISSLEATLSGWSYNGVENEIQSIESHISTFENELHKANTQYAYNVSQLSKMSESKERLRHTILRMKMLLENIKSDVDRLEFIEEASALADQLVEIECPLCHGRIVNNAETDMNSFLDASHKEREKLSMQTKDLDEAIISFVSELQSIQAESERTENDQDALRIQIASVIKDKLAAALENLEEYRTLRDSYKELITKKNQIDAYNKRMLDLELQIATMSRGNKNARKPLVIDSAKLDEFCGFVHRYLKIWGFSDAKVTFINATNDILIGTKAKSAHGKGACAIINTAFVLGLLDYTTSKGYPHPGFVVVDSPITAYKDRDSGYVDNEVPKVIKSLFYASMENMASDKQVIIIENIEPGGAGIKQALHHFTGNPALARTGFIPPRD